MPLYEYVCGACGREFEELSPTVSRCKAPACPQCASQSVQRRPSVFAARGGQTQPAATPSGGACGQCCEADGSCPFN